MNCDIIEGCSTPLEAALIANELQQLDQEAIRIQDLVNAQACQIKDLTEQNCELQKTVACCATEKNIILSKLRISLGKYQAIRNPCA